MGEVKQEEVKPVETKPEEVKQAEEKKEEEVPKPPPPFVLYVDIHCVGCAKKIEKSISKVRGVEGVVIDIAQNQVTIKGKVEPQAVCNMITKITKRKPKVLSPLPEAEGQPLPEVVTSQASELVTIELNVNMHCEACAEQLKKKILKMRGVQTAVTELSTGKVTVTGTMDANKLVDYVYRRTKKQARIVPQPESEPQPQPEKPEEKKEEEAKPAELEAKPEEEKKPEEEVKPSDEANNKEESSGGENQPNNDNNPESNKEETTIETVNHQNMNLYVHDEESMKRMMYLYQPLYVMERIPPPQLFSDENPNACCIS